MMIIPAGALIMVSLLQLCSPAAAQPVQGAGPPPNCPTRCGNVSVPYPFGIGDGCFWPGFNLTCDRTRLLLIGGRGTLQVVEISLANSTVRVVDSAGQVNLTFDGAVDGNGTWGGTGAGPYVVSERHNQFVVTGCNVQATLVGDGGGNNVISGCSSFCSINDKWTGVVTSSPSPGDGATATTCSGIGCCETPIPIGRPSYGVQFKYLDWSHEHDDKLPIAVRIAERGWFDAALLNDSTGYAPSRRPAAPVVLEFAVDSNPVVLPGVATSGCPKDMARSACRSSLSSCHNVTGNYRSGYVCRCHDGYQGNPYLAGGCKDVDECALPGICSGQCTNTAGGYLCRCPRGTSGDPRIKNGCVKSSLGQHNTTGFASLHIG
jgi:hypothetical protein